MRLWPISREKYPKQFCNLIDEKTLFQDTLIRNKDICDRIIIVTNIDQYDHARKQVEEIGIKNYSFIIEPIGRNTAPAITIACMGVDEDDIVFVTPSDHCIKDKEKYSSMLEKANELAGKNYLVTFGIKPHKPETGYGYIEADGENVISFHEKPDEDTARKYINEGNYLWNSGMFMFKAKIYLKEIEYYSNEIFVKSKEAYCKRIIKNNVSEITKQFMEKIPSDSIDYAVMEKSKKIKVIASEIEWSDLGCFEAIYEMLKHDKNGNVSESKNVFLNSKNNLIVSGKRTIVLNDVDDLVVIDTKDALYISKMGTSNKIKELIPKIEKNNPGITKFYAD